MAWWRIFKTRASILADHEEEIRAIVEEGADLWESYTTRKSVKDITLENCVEMAKKAVELNRLSYDLAQKLGWRE